MPRLNFDEPATQARCQATRPDRLAAGPGKLSDDDVVRLSALGLTTLEVAHDLGNLLQVAGSAIRLIDRNLGAASRATMEPIIGGALSSIERAAALSRRILDTGRPRNSGSSAVYLDSLLADMRDELALAAGPTVQLELRLGNYIPALDCSQADLANVILNLAVNARDAMKKGGRLIISVSRAMPVDRGFGDRPDVVLSVSDTGCGMSQEIAAQAFKPFFTTKPGSRGTGLGLAMVSAFAGRLGGAADITSVVGRGTTVILRLPSCGG